jgi:hypothetical protein
MGIDAFELGKHSFTSGIFDWLRGTPIVSYGVVTDVLDRNIVKVELVVRDGASRRYCVVPLLSPYSSLLEVSVTPQKGDLVLLLFLDNYTPQMFSDPISRFEETGDWSVYDPLPPGYGLGAGVGILLAPYRGIADTTLQMHRSEGSPVTTLRSASHISTVLQREVSILFNAMPGEGSVKDRRIQVAFGQNNPLVSTFWAAVTREYGFSILANGEMEELNAPVVERYSIYSPITKDIQGKQTYTIGIGKDGDTEAPVDITLGETADISVVSKSGLSVAFEKDVTVDVEGSVTETVGGDKEETVTGNAKYVSKDTDIESEAPVGINDGLYKTGLKPYLNAETSAVNALKDAAVKANAQLAVLDGFSGGTGFVIGLGAAIVAFCDAVKAMDTDAHDTISKAVK